MQPEIKDTDDIKLLVDSFYDKVRKDDLLKNGLISLAGA